MVFIVCGNSTLLEASVMHGQVWTRTTKLHRVIYALMRRLRSLRVDQVPVHGLTNLQDGHESQVSSTTCGYYMWT